MALLPVFYAKTDPASPADPPYPNFNISIQSGICHGDDGWLIIQIWESPRFPTRLWSHGHGVHLRRQGAGDLSELWQLIDPGI